MIGYAGAALMAREMHPNAKREMIRTPNVEIDPNAKRENKSECQTWKIIRMPNVENDPNAPSTNRDGFAKPENSLFEK